MVITGVLKVMEKQIFGKDENNMKKRLYIAYGSNLNVKQMKIRCPRARIIGTSEIPDYQLIFRGSKTGSYLTIEPKEGSNVPVAVWEVTKFDEASLDLYEGFPKFYYKEQMNLPVKAFNNFEVQEKGVFVYIMHENRPLGIPSRSYIMTCLEGYATFGFDVKNLAKAINVSKEGFRMEEKIRQQMVCPKCGNVYNEPPALSRTDNQTLICPDCGAREALESIGISKSEQEEIIKTIHRY